MAFFLKQPNGLFARFSGVVDHITHHGMSEVDVIRVCAADFGLSLKDSNGALQNAKKDLHPRTKEPGDGTLRWKYAMELIEAIHGTKERQEIEEEILNYVWKQIP
jgi:hypothetical protein